MSTAQAAEHFGVHIKTIFRWIKASKVRAEKVDGEWSIYVNGHYAQDIVPDNAQSNASDNVQSVQDNAQDNAQSDVHLFRAQLERADSEIQHLRDLLTEKDNQLSRRDETISELTQALDHAQQLAAMSQKQSAHFSERLEALEDHRHRPWWKRVFGK